MTEKFTPGEWRRAFNRSRSGNGNVRGRSHCRIENENGVVIAFTVPQSSKQEQVANTNLISAAPKMYQRLKSVKTDLWALSVNPAISAQTKECIDIIIKNIEGDLKKAGGEE